VTILEETEPENRKPEGMINIRETSLQMSAVTDTSEDFLSKEELDYYFNLEELP
jgi:hypothetical protein